MLTTLPGRELSRELVIATIGKYGALNSHTNFDIVSNQLNNNCSSYFTQEDILFFKVRKKKKRWMKMNNSNTRKYRVWNI